MSTLGSILSSTEVNTPFKVTLTAAQVKTLFSSPVTLLAAPGANKIISIDPATIVFKLSAGTAFNFGAGGIIAIYIFSAIASFIDIDVADINSNYFSPNAAFVNLKSLAGNQSSYGVNTPLLIGNNLSDATLGTRTLTIAFTYTIIDVS